MSSRAVFTTLLTAFAIASICAGLTTARQLHDQASNARIISRAQTDLTAEAAPAVAEIRRRRMH